MSNHLKSALDIGQPSKTEIFGRFFSKLHSLQQYEDFQTFEFVHEIHLPWKVQTPETNCSSPQKNKGRFVILPLSKKETKYLVILLLILVFACV